MIRFIKIFIIFGCVNYPPTLKSDGCVSCSNFMKHLILFTLVVGIFSGCQKKSDDTAIPATPQVTLPTIATEIQQAIDGKTIDRVYVVPHPNSAGWLFEDTPLIEFSATSLIIDRTGYYPYDKIKAFILFHLDPGTYYLYVYLVDA